MSATATRPYHHGNLREELLGRAEEILRERGVADLSLRELARDVGVSHAAPRRHFPDRQALLDAMALHGWARLRDELEAAARRSARAGFRTRVERVATAYVTFATRDAALLELMFAAKRREANGPLHRAAEESFGTVHALIAEGQVNREMPPGELDGPGMIIFAMFQGLAALSNAGMLGDDKLRRVVRGSVDALLDGLRPVSAGP